MEVLSARLRTGETVWTFSTKVRQALDALEALGVLTYRGGIVQHTYLVSLTQAGKEAVVDVKYISPLERRMQET